MNEPARLLVIYTSSSEHWGELPMAEALVRKLCALGIKGGTAHEGSMGFGANRRVRHHIASGLADHTPVMVTAADSESRILEAIPHLRALAPTNTMLLLDAQVVPRHGGQTRVFSTEKIAVAR